jgi:hypothetical protein
MTRGILRPLLAGSSAALLISAPAAWAQNIPLTFGISQSFQTLTNPDFQSPSSGTTGMSITSLSFGSFTSTPTDTFSFDAGIGLLIQRQPEGNIDVSPNAPNVALSYDRTTPSSALSVYASYDVIPLDQIRSIEDFITDDGQIDLPSNPADLTSTGLEQDVQAGGSLELGRDALFGLTITASGEQISYSETTDPSLQDINRANVGIAGRFNYSPQGSVSLGVSAEHQVTLVPGTTGAATTDVVRDQQNLTLGTSYDVSPVLSVGGFVSYEVVDESGEAQTRTPRAQISADYTYDTGSLSVRLGDQDSALTWQQSLATGAISATLSHGLDDSGNGTLDQVGFNYSQPINDVSGLALGLFYSGDNGSSTSPDVASAVLVASYNYQLTKDWGMNLGANFRMRDPSNNDDAANATSAGLFLTVSRNVNFLR